jgi:hypothetical protein
MPRTIGGFGRLIAPKDERDNQYRMRAMQPLLGPLVPPRTHAYHEPHQRLNQGTLPHCVAFAGKGFVLAAPIMQDPGYDTTAIYHLCQDMDEWPGSEYDGTSVRALMKVLTAKHWISGYVWGQSIEEVTTWMNHGFGTVIVGTNWYASMDDVDSKGFIQAPPSTATPIGGHAYRINWYDAKKDGYLVVNSWGLSWGTLMDHSTVVRTGMAYLSRDLLIRLMTEDGEIASATQQKIQPVRP